MDYEKLFKRLLMLNNMGVYLHGRDGHIWITQDENMEYPMRLNTVLLNSKIYGGVAQAIETIEEALYKDGQPTLLDRWIEFGKSEMFLGRGGVDESRIDIVAKGKGGLN